METRSGISDQLVRALDNLPQDDFKRVKDKLSHSAFEGKGPIPRGRLEKADTIDTKNLLMEVYSGAAVDVAIDAFTQINLADSAAKLREEREKGKKPEVDREAGRSRRRNRLMVGMTNYQKKYREHVQEKYELIKEKNARLGENVSLDKRYTELLIVQKHRGQEEKEHEIITRGRRHAELMAQQNSVTQISLLFDPDGNQQNPRTVVLQGAAGIGKTMTARKIMLDWASGKLFWKKFDYVFYINCREINRDIKNQSVQNQSVADLAEKNFPNEIRPIKEIFEKPEKLLFIIDGFDELNSLLDIGDNMLCTDPFEKRTVDTTLCSLLRKKVLQKSFLLITTRPTALEKLQQKLEFPRYAEIMGFSAAERKEYFHKFFCDEKKATQAFNFVKENEMLFTMCFVPIVCWIICTVMKQQMEKKEDLTQTSKTTTSVYLLFLSNLLTDHLPDSQIRIQQSNTILWKLCSLAADGILERKILFEEEDLKKHNLSESNIHSLFLNTSIFQKDTECENFYSFIHLSFQEFFAAMYYVLEEDEEAKKKSSTKDMTRLLKIYGASKNNYLMLTVRFLFGLLNKERLNDIEEKLHCKTSSGIEQDLLKWFEAEAKKISSLYYKTNEEQRDQLELFHCLYEKQEEEFAKSAMDNFQEIRLEHLRLTTMDEIALSFCVKNCCSKQSLYLCNCTLGIEEREEGWKAKLRKRLFPLSPLIKDPRLSTAYSLLQGLKDPNCKLRTISLSSCKLSSAFPKDPSLKMLFTNQALEKLDLSANALGDLGLTHLCEGLKQPGCKLQALLLWQCSLTAACCKDLSAALRTNQSLTELELSGNKLGDSGIKLLCEGLKHATCKLRKLVVWDCRLTDACCGDLSSLLSTNQSLRELNLSGNNLTGSGVKFLCEGLRHPKCKLEKLELWQCSLTAACCGDLSTALETNQSLMELELSGNKLGDSGIKLLCEGLKHATCKLQKLVVWDCRLTDACCGDLSCLLSTNPSLRELNLSSNNLTGSGVTLLCEGLRHQNCKLEKLDLSESHIDERTATELDTVQKIKPGLLIVHYPGSISQNPGTETRRMACLLSQCHASICRLTTRSTDMMWNIFVMHYWGIGLVLMLSIATYCLHWLLYICV
ncbi:NACHT, LRR and PYD domains-containing protein 3-like [Pelodiscus sinensis]|uniref:NACHT, LRR and PYD domains-containing protein 3-like n=1 Tax=Pelodiscus sinensis TaxID=13735 RepID=UPI003F6D863B